MGQTLTHGVYLPDEGERNCYSGLAGNWQLLDGAVGTIADHTTALAGKAPAVHTHTKSDITDFPAFGNAAGTICEGNDARLSDARTPVAHTHSKADITDLFNSANTWSNENTFSNLNPIILKNSNIEKGVQPTNFQVQSILFKDKNNSNVAYIRHFVNQSGLTNFNADGLEFSIANKFANGALDPTGTNTSGTFRIGFWTDGQKYIYNEFRWRSSLIPFNNQTQDIGTSTNSWNNLYAKNYYYNGVAWGLDKANVWTADNTFKNTGYQIGETPAATRETFINFTDKNNANIGRIKRRVETSGTSSFELLVYNKFANSQPDTAGTVDYAMMKIGLTSSQTRFCEITGHTYPRSNNTYDLGTSTNKWKSLNGVNPGALSLPVTALNNTYDISGNITDLTGGNNSITAARTGWIFVKSDNATEISIENTTTGMGASDHSASAATLMVSVPVTSGESVNIIANCTSIDKAYLLPCQGNV